MARFESILAALLIATASPVAMADGSPTAADKATARTLFFSAVEASKAGDHAKAADLFDRSNRLYPAPTAALGLARSLEATGQWVKAIETYYALLTSKPAPDEPKAFALARTTAREEVRALEARVPKLVLAVDGAPADDVVVTVDGVVVPTAALGVGRPTDPGRHEVIVRGDGYTDARREVTLDEGQRLEVELSVEEKAVAPPAAPMVEAPDAAPATVEPAKEALRVPAPEPTSGDSGQALRISGFVIGAVGLGGFVGAAVTGGLYVSADQTAQSECGPGPDGATLCSQAGLDAVDLGRSLEPINTAMLAVGGVGVATGVALLIAGYVGEGEMGDEAEVSITPLVSPTEVSLGLSLRF